MSHIGTKEFNTKASALDLSALAARLESQGLAFDGTAGATVNIPAVGTGDFEVLWVDDFPATAGQTIIGANNDTGLHIIRNATNIQVYNSTGALTVANYPVTINTPTIMSVSRSSGVTTARANNVVVGSIADIKDYSLPSLSLGRFLYSGLTTESKLSALRFANFALTDAERTALIARGLVTLPEQRGGSMVALNAGSFVVGKRYRIVTVGTTTFTAIGAASNTVGVGFTATGVGSGTGTALPLGTLYELGDASREAGYMVRDTSGNNAHTELPESGVSIINPADSSTIRYSRASDGWIIGDRRVIPSDHVIDYILVRATAGTPTFHMGSTIGASDVIPSQTLSTAWTKIPDPSESTTGKLHMTRSAGTVQVVVVTKQAPSF